MRGLEELRTQIRREKMRCGNFEWEVNYFDNDGKIKVELFSDVAENLVNKCIYFGENNENAADEDFELNKKGEFRCKYGRNVYKKDCPKKDRKRIRNISLNQIRKFYDEILSFQTQIENSENKKEKFRELLPYIKMQKAKVNLAYNKKNVNTNFKDFIEKNIDYVVDGYDRDLESSLKKFNVFVSLFEAVIAYSKGVISEN
jgi:CRISPR type III-A-associated protein Csm2